MLILRFGMDSDFKVDCRLSHRRSVNLVVVVVVLVLVVLVVLVLLVGLVVVVLVLAKPDPSDDAQWVKTGIDIIFHVILS